MEMHERLKWARERAGYESAAEAARALGLPEPTYSGHENGTRGFRKHAPGYASRFRVSLTWLLTGQGGPDGVGQFAEIFDELSPDAKAQAIAFMEFLRSQQAR